MFLKLNMLLCAFIAIGLTAQAQKKHHVIKTKDAADLHAFFKYTPGGVPLISGHRGGILKNFPENSIATFENTLKYTPAFFEIDPRLTKDSVIVLMHDDTLGRTTNGTGRVADHTWAELKKLRLKDVDGNITPYTIPTLEEAINWARGKTILNLDKKTVPLAVTVQVLKKLHAESHVMLTVHNAKEAQFYYHANPKVMFSAFILTKDALAEYERAGIPWANIMAYIGPKYKPENKELIDVLHARGVMCMISAASTYDKLPDAKEREAAYQEILRSGADVLETDLPIETAKGLKVSMPASGGKARFFEIMK